MTFSDLPISVVVPAYQEAASIGEVLERLVSTLESRFTNYEILVVADGCTDGTEERARQHRNSNIKVLSYQPNRGKGYALRYGTLYAKGSYIAFCDGDLDIHPDSLLVLFDLIKLENAEVAVGSKLHPNSIVNYPKFRRIQSHVFRQIVKLLFKLNISDTQTGLKVFKRQPLIDEITNVLSEGFSFDLELLARMSKKNRIVEGPVWLTYQFQSSINPTVPIKMLRDCFKIRSRLLRETKNDRT